MTMTPSKYTVAAKSLPTPRIWAVAGNGKASDQLALEFYTSFPDPAGHAWRAFSLDTPKEEAAAAFLRRYGRNPEFVFESRGLLLCGPIPAGTLEAVPSEVLL